MLLLSIGTNIGDREQNIANAIAALNQIGVVQAVSPIYTSEPWGFESNNGFYNIVLSMECDLQPLDLLRETQRIERELGRTAKTTTAYTDRVIDIDILDYNNQIIDYRVQITDYRAQTTIYNEPSSKTVPLSKGEDGKANQKRRVSVNSQLSTLNSQLKNSSLLTLPHPLMHLRNFVLYPLADIAPDWVHPTLHLTAKELKEQSKDTSVINILHH